MFLSNEYQKSFHAQAIKIHLVNVTISNCQNTRCFMQNYECLFYPIKDGLKKKNSIALPNCHG